MKQKEALTQGHRDKRAELASRQRDEWDTENRARAERLPKGIKGLWHRITGKFQQVRALNESEAKASQERHAVERERQIEAQREERAVLQNRFRDLRRDQAEQLLELRREIGRYLKFSVAIRHRPGRADRVSASGSPPSSFNLEKSYEQSQ